MWFVARSPFAVPLAIPYRLPLALLAAAAGIVVIAAAIRRFGKAETTVNPLDPNAATSLVTAGIFEHSRNPMYVGLLLIAFGWAIWLSSLANLVVLVLFVVLITELQIKPEEAALRQLFGDAYDQYCRRVRRWF